MKNISSFLILLSMTAPLAAQQLPPIDAGTILNQINNQHPLPQPAPTTLDTCVMTEFKNNKCYFKCQSGAILTEPAIKPDFSTGEPAAQCASYIIRPIPAGFQNKAMGMDLTRPLLMAKMQANTLKTISLMLTGLEAQNSPHKAPAEYTQGIEYAAYDIAEALLDVDSAIKSKDSASLLMAALRMEPMIENLNKLTKSIENEADYSYWAGKEVKQIAAGLGRNVTEIRTNAPFAF